MRLIHGEVTDTTLAVFYEVYNELGWGFSESVYGSVMASLLAKRGLAVTREQPLRVRFRGEDHGEFRADLVVARCVLIELKSCKQIIPAHEAQLLNYLRASGLEVGLLLNFGPKPEIRRLVWSSAYRRLETF
jgi:GxxExxY protein